MIKNYLNALCTNPINALKYAKFCLENKRFFGIHRKFKEFTMVESREYMANLSLVLKTSSVPGAIVECGTWKGGMIAGIAALLGDNREYYLFDSFEGLPKVQNIDGTAAKKWQENTTGPWYFDNCTAAESDALAAMTMANISNPIIVKGWFEKTLPDRSFSEGIAILRMDADWYEPTKQILDSLFSSVNDAGVIIIDDYYLWEGCSKAVHDFLSEHSRPERISNYKGICYIKKVRT